MNGIYTLANDVVYDQLVALLNSIETNVGADFPVAVIAYDDQLDLVKAEVAKRNNVQLLDDAGIFQRWEDFSRRVWQTHPHALQTWQAQGIQGVKRLAANHRYGAFDPAAPFEKFVYFDADVLVLDRLDFIFEQLDRTDFVIYDFQYKDPSHIFNVDSPKFQTVFSEEKIRSEIFCSGFFGAKRSLFPPEQRDWLITQLAAGDADILYLGAPNQSVLNYMRMKAEISIHNFAISLGPGRATGCAVTSPHFKESDGLLYDKGNRVTFLHYIGLPAKIFTSVCAGENLDFPYRDIFLYYRYLHAPEQRPTFSGQPKAWNAPPSFWTKVMKKVGLTR